MIQLINYFIIYSFLGWVTEVVYHVVAQGVVVNRGFLNGPVCPIYGFGMLLILYLLLPISDNSIVLFIGGMVLTTAIELFGGWILEKIFNMRWWDYSEEPFNLHGYICVKFSLAWALGVVGIVRIVHPVVSKLSKLISMSFLRWLLIPLMILFAIDIIATVKSVLHLKHELYALERLSGEIRELSDNLSRIIGSKALETDQKLGEQKVQAALGRAELRQQISEQRKELEREILARKQKAQLIRDYLKSNKLFGTGRLLSAYPHAKIKEQATKLKEIMEKNQF